MVAPATRIRIWKGFVGLAGYWGFGGASPGSLLTILWWVQCAVLLLIQLQAIHPDVAPEWIDRWAGPTSVLVSGRTLLCLYAAHMPMLWAYSLAILSRRGLWTSMCKPEVWRSWFFRFQLLMMIGASLLLAWGYSREYRGGRLEGKVAVSLWLGSVFGGGFLVCLFAAQSTFNMILLHRTQKQLVGDLERPIGGMELLQSPALRSSMMTLIALYVPSVGSILFFFALRIFHAAALWLWPPSVLSSPLAIAKAVAGGGGVAAPSGWVWLPRGGADLLAILWGAWLALNCLLTWVSLGLRVATPCEFGGNVDAEDGEREGEDE